jgi:hypothetical protein
LNFVIAQCRPRCSFFAIPCLLMTRTGPYKSCYFTCYMSFPSFHRPCILSRFLWCLLGALLELWRGLLSLIVALPYWSLFIFDIAITVFSNIIFEHNVSWKQVTVSFDETIRGYGFEKLSYFVIYQWGIVIFTILINR